MQGRFGHWCNLQSSNDERPRVFITSSIIPCCYTLSYSSNSSTTRHNRAYIQRPAFGNVLPGLLYLLDPLVLNVSLSNMVISSLVIQTV